MQDLGLTIHCCVLPKIPSKQILTNTYSPALQREIAVTEARTVCRVQLVRMSDSQESMLFLQSVSGTARVHL